MNPIRKKVVTLCMFNPPPLSNHSKTIIKHIPKSISRRISSNSSSKEIFDKHKDFYKALVNGEYKEISLEYIEPSSKAPTSRKTRKRIIIWFTPPSFNQMVKTNLEKKIHKSH